MRMGTVVYTMSHSLDGFIVDRDGGLEWGVPDPVWFRDETDEVRGLSAHLLGRRLYEAMTYWDDPEAIATFDDDEQRFAEAWRAVPKIVFSRTLVEVHGAATRLATAPLEVELARLRDDPAVGEIAIGGATLAAAAAAADLIDEFRPSVHPVLLGSGIPYYPPVDGRLDLELVSTRTYGGRVVASRYRVRRESA